MANDARNHDQTVTDQIAPLWGAGYWRDYGGSIISDPQVAILELVANAYDAGATVVEITLPTEIHGIFRIKDNGTGMTPDEFLRRWREFSYNRKDHQGLEVEFPPESECAPRTAFGRNGKGRHACFCFSSEYEVRTAKEGGECTFSVKKSHGDSPFEIVNQGSVKADWHGTEISAHVDQVLTLDRNEVVRLIGGKFLFNPEFQVLVNGHEVELTDIPDLHSSESISLSSGATATVVHIDANDRSRTTKFNGIAFWVNNRLVGNPSWDIQGEHLLDGRTKVAKQHSFIVNCADMGDDVEPDWTAFRNNDNTEELLGHISRIVREKIGEILESSFSERKREVIRRNRDDIESLPASSRGTVAEFIDEVQPLIPTIPESDLANLVQVVINLEKSRTKFDLLRQLSTTSSSDLDELNSILDKWSIRDAKVVLDELDQRLNIISELERLTPSKESDELHQIHPLFDHGLWIFGPQYEAIDFTSNQTLSTVVKKLLGGDAIEDPRIRPDFVVTPEGMISTHSADGYDDDGMVTGLRSVLVVEIKRGGFKIDLDEKHQAMKYLINIRETGHVPSDAKLTAFVIGSEIATRARETTQEGSSLVRPITYEALIRQAHNRTFKLKERLTDKFGLTEDTDIAAVFSEPTQQNLE